MRWLLARLRNAMPITTKTTVRSLAVEPASRDNRRLLSLQQEFALFGLRLDPLSGTTLLVQNKIGLSKTLADLNAAEQFLRATQGAM